MKNISSRFMQQKSKTIIQVAAFLFLLLPSLAFSQNYISFQDGLWSDVNSWRVGGAVPATPPSSTSGSIRIDHLITVAAVVTADQVTITAPGVNTALGGRLVINNTLTVNNGTGNDFTINGSLTVNGTLTTAGNANYVSSATGIVTINSGGVFRTTGSGTVTHNCSITNYGTIDDTGTGTITYVGAVINEGTMSDSGTGGNLNFNNSANAITNQNGGVLNFAGTAGTTTIRGNATLGGLTTSFRALTFTPTANLTATASSTNGLVVALGLTVGANNGTFGATLILNTVATLNGAITINNTTNPSSITANNDMIKGTGNFNVVSPGFFLSNSTTTFPNVATRQLQGSGLKTFRHVVINGPVTVAANVSYTITGDLSGASSTLGAGSTSGTVTFTGVNSASVGNPTISGTSGFSFYGLTVPTGVVLTNNASGTCTLTGPLTCSGTGYYYGGAANTTTFGTSTMSLGNSNTSFNNVSITGTLSAAGTFSVRGNMTRSGTFTASTSTVIFDGTTTIGAAFTTTSAFNNVTINSGRTLSAISTNGITVNGTFNNNGGTVSFGGTTTVLLAGTGAQTLTTASGSATFNALTLTPGGTSTFTATADLTVNGALTISNGATLNTVNFNKAAGAFVGSGTFSSTGLSTFSGATLISGAGTKNFNNFTVSSAGNLTNTTSDMTISGILDNQGTINFTTAGTVLLSGNVSSTLQGAASAAFFNLTLTPSTTSTITATRPLTVSGTLTVNNGATLTTNSTLALSGNFTINSGGTVTPTVGSVVTKSTNGTLFTINLGGTYTSTGTTNFTGNVTLGGTGSKTFAALNVSANTLTVSANVNYTVTGALNTTGGILGASSGTGTVTFDGTSALTGTVNFFNVVVNITKSVSTTSSAVNISGTLTNNGTINFTTAGVTTLSSNVIHSLDGVSAAFFDLTMSNGTVNATTDLTVGGVLTISAGTLNAVNFNKGTGNFVGTGNFTSTGLTTFTGGTTTFSGAGTKNFKDFTVNSGVTTSNVISDMTISGILDNQGTINFTTAGTVLLTGNVSSTLRGTSAAFFNLTLTPTPATSATITGTAGLTVSGTLTINSAATLTTNSTIALSGNLTINSGGTLSSSSTVTKSTAATLFTVNSGGTYSSTGTTDFVNSTTIGGTGSKTFGVLNVTAGTLTVSANVSYTVTGNINMTGTALNASSGTGTVTFNGATVITGTVNFFNVLVNSTRSVSTTSSTVNISGTLTNNGTINFTTAGTTTLSVNGTSTLAGTSATFFNLTINNNSIVNSTADLTVGGVLTITAGTLNTINFNKGAGNFVGAGNFASTGLTTFTGAVTFSGAGTKNFTDFTVNNGVTITNTAVNMGISGILDNLGTINFTTAGTVTLTGNITTSKLRGTSATFFNLTLTPGNTTPNSAIVTVTSPLTIQGDLIVSSGATITSTSTVTKNTTPAGAFTVDGIYDSSSGSTVFAINTALSGSGSLLFTNLTVNNGVTLTNPAGTNTIVVSGVLTNSTSGVINFASGLVTMGATSTTTLSGTSATFNDLTLTAGSASLTATTALIVNGTLTVNAGNSITSTTTTLGDASLGGSTQLFTTLTLNASAVVTATTDVTVSGVLTIGNLANFNTVNLNKGAGNFVATGNYSSTGLTSFTGAATISGAGTLNFRDFTVNPGVTLSNTTASMTISGILDNQGTINFTAAGMVTLTGNILTSQLRGTSATFFNLTLTPGNTTPNSAIVTVSAPLFIAGNLVINSGARITSTATITKNTTSGGAFTVNGLFDSSSGTTVFAINTTLSGSGTLLFTNLTVNDGVTLTNSAGTNVISISGTFSNSTTGVINFTAGAVAMGANSTTTLNAGTTATFYDLNLASGPASLTTSGTLTIGGILNVNTGNSITSTTTIINGNASLGGSTQSFTTFTLGGGATVTATTNMTVSGVLTIGALANLNTVNLNKGAGNFVATGNYTSTGLTTFTGAVTISGAGTKNFNDFTVNPGITVSNTTASLTIGGILDNQGTINFTTAGTVTVTGNVLTSQLRGTSATFFNLTLQPSTTSLVTATTPLTVTGDLVIGTGATLTTNAAVTKSTTSGGLFTVDGTYNATAGTTTISISTNMGGNGTKTFFGLSVSGGTTSMSGSDYRVLSDLTVAGTALSSNVSTVSVIFGDGVTARTTTITGAGVKNFYNVTVAANQTLVANAAYIVYGTTYTNNGTVNAGSGTVSFGNIVGTTLVNNGLLNFNNVAYVFNGGSGVLNGSNVIFGIAGTYNNSNGTLNEGTSTVIFNGIASQTLTGIETWNNVEITNPVNVTSGSNQTISGTFKNYGIYTNTVTLTLSAASRNFGTTGSPYTAANGVLVPVATTARLTAVTLVNNGAFTADADAGTGVTISGAVSGTGTYVSSGTTSFSGNQNFDLSGGLISFFDLTFTANTRTFLRDYTVTRNLSGAGAVTVSGTRVTTFNGAVSGAISGAGGKTFYDVTVDKSGGASLTLAGDFTVTGTAFQNTGASIVDGTSGAAAFTNTVGAGTIITNSSTGQLNFYSLNFGAAANRARLAAGTTIGVKGNYSTASAANVDLTTNACTVDFNGSVPQSILTTGETFTNLTITNNTASGVTTSLTQIVNGTFTNNGRYIQTGASTLQLQGAAANLNNGSTTTLVTLSATPTTITLAGNAAVLISGNVSGASGSYVSTGSTSTTTFTGGTQTFALGGASGISFYDLVINSTVSQTFSNGYSVLHDLSGSGTLAQGAVLTTFSGTTSGQITSSGGTKTFNNITFNKSGGASLTLAGNITIAGTTVQNTGASIVDGTAGTTTFSNAVLTTITNSSTGSLDFFNLNFLAAASRARLALNTTIGIKGDYTTASAANFDLTTNACTVAFNGTALQSILTTSETFTNLTINNNAGGVTTALAQNVAGVFTNNGKYTHTANTLALTGATAALNDGSTTTLVGLTAIPTAITAGSTAIVTISGDVSGTGSYTSAGTTTVNGTTQTFGLSGGTSFTDLVVNSSTSETFGNNYTVLRDLSGTGVLNAGSATAIFSGASAGQIVGGTKNFNNITVSKSNATLTLNVGIGVFGTAFTNTPAISSVVDGASSTVTFSNTVGSGTVVSNTNGTLDLFNVAFTASGKAQLAANTTLGIKGDFTNQAASSFDPTTNSGTVVNFNGSGLQTLSGVAETFGGLTITNNNSGVTTALDQNVAGVFTNNGKYTHTGATTLALTGASASLANGSTSTLVGLSATPTAISAGATSIVTISGNVSGTGSYSSAGTTTLNGATQTFGLSGGTSFNNLAVNSSVSETFTNDYIINGNLLGTGILLPGTVTANFSGATNGQIQSGGTWNFFNVNINKTGGAALDLASNLSISGTSFTNTGRVTHTSGTVTFSNTGVSGTTITSAGITLGVPDLTLGNIAFAANGKLQLLNNSTLLGISGSLSPNDAASFNPTANVGSVYFNGASAQSLPSEAFNNLVISNTSVGGVSTSISPTIAGTFTLATNGVYSQTGGSALVVNTGSSAAAGSKLNLSGNFDGPYSAVASAETIFGGATTIGSTGVKSFGAFTIAASSTVTVPATLTIVGNFTNNGLSNSFTHSNGTVTFAGATQSLSGNGVTFNNITIGNGGSTAVTNALSPLSLAGALNFSPTGTVSFDTGDLSYATTASDKFVLLSASETANGGTVGPLSATATLAGTMQAQRFLSPKTVVTTNGRVYRYVSAPVVGATIKNIQDSGVPVTGLTPSGDNSVCPTCIATANPIQYFNENLATPAFASIPGAALSTAFANGRGYGVFIRQDIIDINNGNTPNTPVTLKFKGTHRVTGAGISLPLSTASGKYSLVGNPYPSPIRWELNSAGLAAAPLFSSINAYALLRNSNNQGQSAAGSNPVTNPAGMYTYIISGPTAVIGAGQAFLVYTQAANATLTINEAAKVTDAATFYRTAAEPTDELEIRLTKVSTGATDLSKVIIREGTSSGFDYFDAPKFDNTFEDGVNQFDLGTFAEDNSMVMAMNSVPTLKGVNKINLSIADLLYSPTGDIEQKATYSFNFTPLGSLSTQFKFVLHDNFLNIDRVVTNGNYTFTVNNGIADSKATNRFYLKVLALNGDVSKQEQLVDTDSDELGKLIEIYPNPASSNVYINFTGKGDVSVDLIDVRGGVLNHVNLTIEDDIQKGQLDVSAYSSGLYFIRAISGSNSVIKKVIIK